MSFEIICLAIKEFDAESKSYLKCRQILQVKESQIGTLVQCPACGNDVEVRSPAVLTQSGNATPSTDRSGTSTTQQSGESVDESNSLDSIVQSTAEPIDVSDRKSDDILVSPGRSQQNDLELAGNQNFPVHFQSPGVDNPNLPLRKEPFKNSTGETLQQTSFSADVSCRKCGTVLMVNQPRCPNCQTPREAAYVKKEDRIVLKNRGPYGFQLWVDSLLSRDKSKNSAMQMIGYLLVIVILAIGLTSLVLGNVFGKILGILFLLFGSSLLYIFITFDRIRKNPRTTIPAVGRLAWNIMLAMCQSMQYGKFPNEKILDKRNEEDFGDQQLRIDRNISRYKVIELEGTNISDEGLLFFYNHRGIKYLNVRNTNVSAEAVHDLQETIPKTWIWY